MILKSGIRYVSFLLILSVSSLIIPTKLLAQRNCGTVEYQQQLQEQNPGYENTEQFEEWLKQRIDDKNRPQNLRLFSVKEPLLQIPVVVHVVHNGEPYGEGSNIPDEQILSQIEALNEDFRRQNTDADQTLIIFQPVAADTEIEFVLARQDPDGQPTTGIIRLQGSQTSWSFNTDTELKSLSYWPAEDYMNIWVTVLGGGLLGYAQLPISNLPGLEDGSTNALTDGVVIGHQYFGSSAKFPEAELEAPWDLGRTTTHEVGHFLGLRHIWGDCGCSCDDYVADTPLQENSTNNCPETKQSCGNQNMFQNYMDYTDDACMNIFTSLQKERMRIVLESSPRRLTLPGSPGLNDPIVANVDLGIRNIIEPSHGICESSIIPSIEVRSYGSDLVNSATIEVLVNDVILESRNFDLNLTKLESQTVVFSETPVPGPGSAIFEFRIIEVNGNPDENSENDTISIDVLIPYLVNLPIDETFETDPVTWTIQNNDNDITWEQWQSPSKDLLNHAMRLNFNDYNSLGELDFLISPQIDLNGATTVELLFDLSYAYSPGFNNDQLTIALSENCGQTFDLVIFNRKGISLSTTENTSLPFIPTDRSDWQRMSINLNQFADSDGIQIAFIGINGGGNNLYLDNITVVGQDFIDIGISELSKPGYVFCDEGFQPELTIENTGSLTINDVELSYTINNGPQIVKSYSALGIDPGSIYNLELDPLSSGESSFDFDFNVSTDNDSDPSNNTYSILIFESCYEEAIPLREDFEDIGTGVSNWIIYDKGGMGTTWKKAEMSESAIVFENFNESVMGSQALVFSPLLDLTETTKASLFFDVSYASNTNPGELLRIKVSTDNGITFPDVVYEKSGTELSITNATGPWIPTSNSDWIREFIPLNDYAGNRILLTFEATGMSGNNLYIDNLEFYTDHNPNPLVFNNPLRIYPNPSRDGKLNLTFNLVEKENIQISVYDLLGNKVFQSELPNTLNQTYPFDFAGKMDGIYIIKTVGNSLNTSSRIFINP